MSDSSEFDEAPESKIPRTVSATEETKLKYVGASPSVQKLVLCDRCSQMMTREGWILLRSEGGYKHYNRNQLVMASKYCALCFFMWMQLRNRWRPDRIGNVQMYTSAKTELGFSESLQGRVELKAIGNPKPDNLLGLFGVCW